MCMQVGLELAGGSSLLPYTNTTNQILVAAFKKSVNNDGRVQLLSVEVNQSCPSLLERPNQAYHIHKSFPFKHLSSLKVII